MVQLPQFAWRFYYFRRPRNNSAARGNGESVVQAPSALSKRKRVYSGRALFSIIYVADLHLVVKNIYFSFASVLQRVFFIDFCAFYCIASMKCTIREVSLYTC
jgi:hypothetical protein